jgi:CheY-like chemotaxis protein
MRVLYVDDEPDLCEIAAVALEMDSDLEVEVAHSGPEALIKAADWRPDIILLDVMMPHMDGPATLARLRRNEATRELPVVFITAQAESRDVDRFKRLGAVAVIPKPFDPLRLAVQVRTLTERLGFS